MTRNIYRYTFAPDVSLEDVECTLLLAFWGTESLHGETQVRLEVGCLLDKQRRACVIDAGSPAGQDLNRLFIGFIRRELAASAFRLERFTESNPIHQPEEVHV